MKIQTIERRIQTAARDLELEIAAMEPDGRTRHGERREHLMSELELLTRLLGQIEEWNLAEARKAVDRMSMLRRSSDAPRGEE